MIQLIDQYFKVQQKFLPPTLNLTDILYFFKIAYKNQKKNYKPTSTMPALCNYQNLYEIHRSREYMQQI
jgi:hypothetical protein